MSDAIPARGTLLKVDDGVGVYTTIAEVRSITGPTRTRRLITVTNHSSPGNYDEYKPGIKDGGELTFTCNWLPTNATHDATTGLEALFENGTQRNFRLEAPSPSTAKRQFPGVITSLGNNWDLEGVLEFPITVKVVGQVVPV